MNIEEIIIPVLDGSHFDLSKFNFSKYGVKIYNTESEHLKNYVKSLNISNFEYNIEIIERINSDKIDNYHELYALVLERPFNKYDNKLLENIWKLLLILYPSKLQILYELIFSKVSDKEYSFHGYSSKRISHNNDPLLFASEDDISKVNEFISKYLERVDCDNYIGLAIENYITSFFSSHIHFQYINLFMSLENIIYGPNELTYRLKRGIAILCGEEAFNSNIIFNNLNKMYLLRSKIVHGEEYDQKKVKEYIPYLKALVSRTIIELIIHNISSTKILNNKLTEIGYGDRNKLSDDWKYYDFNIRIIVDTNWYDI